MLDQKSTEQVSLKNEALYSDIDEKLISDNKDIDGLKLYSREIKKYPLLSLEDTFNLFRLYQQGDNEAKEQLVNSNLRLVLFCAKKFIGRGLEYADLVQEGNLGLVAAIERYNPELGFKFSGFAYPWICGYIHRAINRTGRLVAVPRDAIEDYYKNRQQVYAVEEKLGRKLTRTEFNELLKCGKFLFSCFQVLDNSSTSLNSLIKNTDETPSTEVIDLYYSDKETSLEDFVINKIMGEKIIECLNNSQLSDSEKDMLLLRFGFYDDRIFSLNEIGAIYNMTHQAVSQKISRALKKIRNMPELSIHHEGIDNTSYSLTKNNPYAHQ